MTRAEQLAYEVRNAYYLEDVSDQLLEMGRMAGCEREVSELLKNDDRGFRDFVLLQIQYRLGVWLCQRTNL